MCFGYYYMKYLSINVTYLCVNQVTAFAYKALLRLYLKSLGYGTKCTGTFYYNMQTFHKFYKNTEYIAVSGYITTKNKNINLLSILKADIRDNGFRNIGQRNKQNILLKFIAFKIHT